MKLSKQEILTKLDANQVTQFRDLSYQFFDKGARGLGGFAQIRFEKGESILIAEATFWGNVPGTLEEERVSKPKLIEIRAQRQWIDGDYEISTVHVDGESYDVNDPAMIELSFAIFNSRLDEVRYYAENGLVKAQPVIKTKETGVTIAQAADLYRDTLSTVLDDTKRIKAEKIANRMPRIAFGETIIDFNGLDQALSVNG